MFPKSSNAVGNALFKIEKLLLLVPLFDTIVLPIVKIFEFRGLSKNIPSAAPVPGVLPLPPAPPVQPLIVQLIIIYIPEIIILTPPAPPLPPPITPSPP